MSTLPIALVTGATSGIGLATVQALASDHHIIALARNQQRLDDLVASLPSAQAVSVDLSDAEAVAEAVNELGLERLDVLVNSAGVEAAGRLEELSVSQWRQVLDLDLVAPAQLTTLLLPALRKAHGLVVMLNSGAGTRVRPGQGLYCAAKHGLRALADALREEERGRIRVTTIYPGRTDTAMQRRLHNLGATTGSGKGGDYCAADHMQAASVAKAIRLAVDMTLDATIEDLHIRPSDLPQD